MNLRNKLLLVFFALAFVPLVIVGLVNYRSGLSAVGAQLRARADESAARISRRVERTLDKRESRLLELASADPLRAYVRDARDTRAAAGASGAGGTQQTTSGAQTAAGQARPAKPDIPETVRAPLGAFFKNNREYLESVTCLDASGGPPLFRLPGGSTSSASPGDEVNFQTDFFVERETRYDKRVWGLQKAEALRSPVKEESYGAALRVTVPVYSPADDSIIGALVAEIKLKNVVEDAAETDAPAAKAPTRDRAQASRQGVAGGGVTAASPGEARPIVVVIDNVTGVVIYDTSGGFRQQVAEAAMPEFAGVAASMRSGASGWNFYDEPGGVRRLAVFRQVDALNLSLAVAEDYTTAAGPVRRWDLLAVALALAASASALVLLLLIARRTTEDLERVARAAAAIAEGQVSQRIPPGATAETRALAESFNKMSDRLRGFIAKEAESRQFESFMRISAMITHDLKNAIAGLSMLVANMERRWNQEEFRADAVESLRDATEKLNRTAARLSEPAKSLSGEYRMTAREIDLVPVFRRVLATVAEPSRPLYEVEARLPDSLVAWVEATRIENVFENLVINALEAMGAKGGTLSVEAGALEGGLVFFSVADTGVGMTEEFVKERLFRPFSTTKTKGIGLGLFTCKEVVEAHGGRLEVESRVGVGTRFRVVLPSRLFKSGERRGQPGKATAAVEPRGPGAPV
ncbi:MAG TPA: ATP-binding protein [Pyrinomonadaceae bacterium]|nr:ATP-binding protein [Pyrinomonadaceae bacterium]